jgi:hypothetical protein
MLTAPSTVLARQLAHMPALQGEGQVDAGAQAGTEDRLAGSHRHLAALAVGDDHGHAGGRCGNIERGN